MTEPTYSVLSFPAASLPERYVALVFTRWLRSLRQGNPFFHKITPDDYFKNYHPFLTSLLQKPDSVVRLAVLSDDHDVTLGFAVSREDVLDYVYVQKDFRKIGVARSLIPNGITTFSHITLTALNIWQENEKYKPWHFNPFA